MSIKKALIEGFNQTWQHKKLIFLIYAISLLFAVFGAYPFKMLLEKTVGNSLMVKDIVAGFNYEFINDFNNNYGVALSPIFNQSTIIIIFFLLLMIFFSGGIISVFIENENKRSKEIFWTKSACFFWKIFRLTLLFIFIHIFFISCFYNIFYQTVEGFSLFELESDGSISYTLKIILPIYLIVVSLFFMLQDYSKILIVKSKKKWLFQTVFCAFKFIMKNFLRVYCLYMINILLWVIFILINYYLSLTITFNTGIDILFSFLLTQIFVLIRLSLKFINIGSIIEIHKQSPN